VSKVKQGLVRTSRNEQGLVGIRANPFYSVLIREKGFTLLEVMVAVFILGVGLLAIMHLFPIGLRASKVSQDTTLASFLAQAKMEELKNTVWSSIVNEPKSEISGTIFSQEVTVNELETDLLKRITVAVFWTEYEAERSVKLVTLLTNYKKTM